MFPGEGLMISPFISWLASKHSRLVRDLHMICKPVNEEKLLVSKQMEVRIRVLPIV